MFGVSSDPDSEFRLALHPKRCKLKLAISTVYLEKCNFFANDTKYRHIIYCWKVFFDTIMDLRSLPQNKALVGLDQQLKFRHFARKSVPTIWALSSRTKGIFLKRKLC